jgi:RibD C-terminal domain
MAIWETPDVIPNRTPAMLDFARIWQAADKIVYSKSLETVFTPKTRLDREFDLQSVRDLKAQSPHDVSVAGPTLAAQAIRTGLVDEVDLLIVPVMFGGGKPVLPSNVWAGASADSPHRRLLVFRRLVFECGKRETHRRWSGHCLPRLAPDLQPRKTRLAAGQGRMDLYNRRSRPSFRAATRYQRDPA